MIEQSKKKKKAIEKRIERMRKEEEREREREREKEREEMRGDDTTQSGRMRSFGCADINATGQVMP